MVPKRPLRIATLGDYNKYFSYFLAGTQEGTILNGCWFRPIDIRQSKDQIYNCLKQFMPDILFCHCIFGNTFRPPEQFEILNRIRKEFGTKVFYHLGDHRREPRHPHPLSGIVDGCLVNQTENLKKFSEIWKVPTYHWPYWALQQREMADPVVEFKHALVFTGRLNNISGIHYQRTIFMRDIQSKIAIKLYPDEKYPDTKLLTADIASSAKAVLGVCTSYDLDGYMDVRPMQYTGAGAFLLQRKYKGMEKVFENEKHLVWFNHDNSNEFVELYNYWMSKPNDVQKIRQQGFDFCQKYHSSYNRIKDIIGIVYNEQKNTKIFLEDLDR